MKNKFLLILALGIAALTGCSNTKTASESATTVTEPQPKVIFNGDSAYKHVKVQCDFGPRVPNTEAHGKCGDYLVATLNGYGAKVTEQKVDLTAFDGTILHARNIIAEFYPEKANRICLLAHWDCRPWADNDPSEANHTKPVMGANDGASGVGVLLEIARLLATNEPQCGIDILLSDAEDWGESDADNAESWAMGTRYWVKNVHREGYRYPNFGILLDMVGDAEAKFLKEYYSVQSAPSVVNQVWTTAASLGYGNKFVNEFGGAMTDDHVALIEAGIPCIDIIDQRRDSPTGFCPQWHTVDDVMKHISKETLTAVGQTVTSVIFGE